MLLKRTRRAPPTAPTPFLIETIRQLSAQKLTRDEIATRIGVSVSSVARWQRQYGIPAMSRSEGRMASRSRGADRRDNLGKFCPKDSGFRRNSASPRKGGA